MKTFIVALLVVMVCTGCWDRKEINDLAIVSAMGLDKDPDTGAITMYYQIINPSALAPRQGGGAKAAVYTFAYRDKSLGQFPWLSTTLLPRKLFTPHVQSLIVSERYARDGVLDILNYFESNPQLRMNTYFLVADTPIDVLMNSFTPLDRVPGRYIRSLMHQHGQVFRAGVEPIRVKDLTKRLKLNQPTVVPIVKYPGTKPASNAGKLDGIDVNEYGMSFADGAVFREAKMTGRLSFEEKMYFFVLNGEAQTFTIKIKVGEAFVDVEADHVRVRREWVASANRVRVAVAADLNVLNGADELTEANVRSIRDAFERSVERSIEALIEKGRANGWDLLGVQDLRGVRTADWRSAQAKVEVRTVVASTGGLLRPYETKR